MLCIVCIHIHSCFIYFLYVMYFIQNLNEIESEMVPGNENITHITVLHQA